jgi:hypothetical protein
MWGLAMTIFAKRRMNVSDWAAVQDKVGELQMGLLAPHGTGAAPRAGQRARQGFRIDEADVATLLAGDLEHHPGCAPSSSGGEAEQAPSPRSLFEYPSAHENADEQQQHDDDEDELDHWTRASVLASVAETVSARDAAVAARAKKPRQTPGLKSHREIRIPGVHATRSSEVPARAKIRLLRGRGWRYRPHCRRLFLGGTKKPPEVAGG